MALNPEIYCPRCEYRPKADDRWDCTPTCGTRWHTFWTGGVCPGCGVRWPTTQCPACAEHSPHPDWYHYPPDAEIQGALEKQKETAPAAAASPSTT
jgi:hypothetical protein